MDPFLQAQSAAVARDRAVSEAQGLREQIAKLKAEVEGLSQLSDKTNGINSKDTDSSINNGVAFAEHCPNCGYSIATTQTEEHSEHGHHHFLSMSKVSQSEQAILSIEKRLADESQASLRNQSVCQNRLTACINGCTIFCTASIHGCAIFSTRRVIFLYKSALKYADESASSPHPSAALPRFPPACPRGISCRISRRVG